MGFIAPLLLLGVVAVAVPIAIHLFGRRRAKTVPFAAIEFLFESNRKTARSIQIREKALLITRALACLAIPLALAKPYASCNQQGPQVTGGQQAAVIIVDDGYPSGIDNGGKPWLAAATAQAMLVIAQLGPDADIAIVLTSAANDAPTELTRNHVRLRDQLRALTPSAKPADTNRALAAAAALLTTSGQSKRTVYLLSMMTQTSFLPGPPPWDAGGPTLVTVPIPVTNRDNLAVTNVTVTPDPSVGVGGFAVLAEIWNGTALPVTDLDVALQVDNAVVARGKIEIAPFSKQTKRFLATMPNRDVGADVAVMIPRDRLAADDVHYARATRRDDVRVLLVNGDPRNTRREDETFFLETALRPGDQFDSGTTVRTITVDDMSPATLAEADVVVLANVPALAASKATHVATWVRAGGGLLIAVGDHYQADEYNRTMHELLPQAVGDIVAPTWGAGPTEQAAQALHLEKLEMDHPVFATVSKQATELRSAKFDKIVLLGQDAPGSDRKVLARFSNGAVALIEATLGLGRVALYTSSVDRGWNDLALHPGYLPVMQQLMRYLAKRQATSTIGKYEVGASVTLPATGITKLDVRGPSGNSATFGRDRLVNRNVVRFSNTHAPGQYQVRTVDLAGRNVQREELGFAVNLASAGADLRPAPPQALPASGNPVEGDAGPAKRRVELWHGVAAALLLLLLLEGLLLLRR